MGKFILFKVEEHVAVVTFNAPERKNSLCDEMIKELVETLDTAGRDLDVRCVILHGAGGAFCAGGSIKEMKDRTGYAGGGPVNSWKSMLHGFQAIPRAFFALDVPVIAAIDGPAIGAGCDIAAMCDIRIASEKASFAESFARLGVISGDGGSWYLARALGFSRAAEMTFTGDAIDAETAVKWGFASRVVPADGLLEEAHALARRIALNPPQTLRLAKRLLREASEQGLHTSLELAAAMQGIALHTEDQREAVSAMMEKRQPQFRGL